MNSSCSPKGRLEFAKYSTHDYSSQSFHTFCRINRPLCMELDDFRLFTRTRLPAGESDLDGEEEKEEVVGKGEEVDVDCKNSAISELSKEIASIHHNEEMRVQSGWI